MDKAPLHICTKCRSHEAAPGCRHCVKCRAYMRRYTQARQGDGLCTYCHRRRPRRGYRKCAACRRYFRTYEYRERNPGRITLHDKARAWLAVAPRTPAQLAELLDISAAHAAVLISHIRQERVHD